MVLRIGYLEIGVEYGETFDSITDNPTRDEDMNKNRKKYLEQYFTENINDLHS